MQYRVHFAYWKQGEVWRYQFVDQGLAVMGAVRRTRKEADIRAIAERGGGIMNSEARCMLDLGLSKGSGGEAAIPVKECC